MCRFVYICLCAWREMFVFGETALGWYNLLLLNKGIKMTDYDATLQEFFSDVLLFLERRKQRAKDVEEQKRIIDVIAVVQTVARNPVKYADYAVRAKDGLERLGLADAYSSVYLIYSKVLAIMGKLHSQFDLERAEAQKILLNARKQMRYKNSTNILKDFYFPFVSPERYGVKKDSKTR